MEADEGRSNYAGLLLGRDSGRFDLEFISFGDNAKLIYLLYLNKEALLHNMHNPLHSLNRTS